MRNILLALVVLLSVAALAADKIQPLNVKLGLWETTHTTTMSGEMPVPPEMLTRLTPEQRARVEAAMKANSGKTTTSTYKSCLTKEKLEKDPFSDKEKECARTIVTSNSSEAEVKFTCDLKGTKMSGTVHIVAVTPESVKGSVQTNAAGGGHAMSGQGTFTSKWLGSACGDVQ